MKAKSGKVFHKSPELLPLKEKNVSYVLIDFQKSSILKAT